MLQVKQASNSRAGRCTLWSVCGYKELLCVCLEVCVCVESVYSEHSTGHKTFSLYRACFAKLLLNVCATNR